MEEKGEEEDHEVHGAIVPEGFVDWSEPAHIGCRCEQEPVDQGQSKGCTWVLSSGK